MPGKSTKEGKTPKPRKRNSSNSSSTSDQTSNHSTDESNPLAMQQNPNSVPRYSDPNAPSYYPPYRDDGQGQGYPPQNYYPQPSHQQQVMPHMSGPPSTASASPMQQNMQPGSMNGMGMTMGGTGGIPAQNTSSFPYPPQPLSRNQPSGVVENGHSSHSSPSPSQSPQVAIPAQERDHCSKILDQNAQVILQINQAIMENRQDVINELMPILSKNIQYLSSLSEQQPSLHHPTMPPPDLHRVSQSPLPVRPVSQGTPPHISPPPGTPQQMNIQNGSPYIQHAAYAPYGQTQQPRPQPVYSPLSQSTAAMQPRSPNVTFQNGPNRPATYPQQMQHQQGYPPTSMAMGQANTAMPPPMNYPYPPQSRAGGMPNYGTASNYSPQEQNDPNYSAMPPPQIQPKRSASTPYRPPIPQNAGPDQRQMSYQPRMYSNAYAQDSTSQQSMQYSNQQPIMTNPSQQQHQMYATQQHPHQQQSMMMPVASSSSYPSSLPTNQYSMPHGQFRTPAVPPPTSPYGMPSPSGSTSSG